MIAATEGAVTPDSDWWGRAKLPPRPQPIEIRKRELLATLRKGEHAVTLEKRPVYGVADWLGGVVVFGEELILSIGREWTRMRVFKTHEPEALQTAVSETRTWLFGEGWE